MRTLPLFQGGVSVHMIVRGCEQRRNEVVNEDMTHQVEEFESDMALPQDLLDSVLAWGVSATRDRAHPANPVTVKVSGRERTQEVVD